MRAISRYMLLLASLTTLVPPTAGASPEGADSAKLKQDVMEAFRAREALIETIGFRFRYTFTPEEWFKETLPPSETRYIVRFKGRMRVFERLAQGAEIEGQYAFDGKKSYLMDRGKQQDSLLLQDGMAGQIYSILSPMKFLLEDQNDFPLLYFIERAESARMEDGLVRLDGNGDDLGLAKCAYWCDPLRGFAVSRFETALKGETRFRGLVEEWDLADIGSETVHIPKTMSVIGLEDGKVKYTKRVFLEDYAINQPYPDESFVPEVNKERITGVWDRNLRMGYALGDPDPDSAGQPAEDLSGVSLESQGNDSPRNDAQGVAASTNAAAGETGDSPGAERRTSWPGPEAARTRSSFPTAIALVVGFLALAGACWFVLAARRRRR